MVEENEKRDETQFEVEKIQVEGLGEVEVSKEGIEAAASKAALSMKDSHDKVMAKGNELAQAVARIAELEALQTTTPAQNTDFAVADDDYVQGKDLKNAIANAVAKAVAGVKNDLQPTLQSVSASARETQTAQIRAKRPDMTNEEIQKVIEIEQTFNPGLMKDILMRQGYSIQSVDNTDMALYLYEGTQKGFGSGSSGTAGIHMTTVRRDSSPKKETDDDKLAALGKTDKEIAEIKQLCADTKMTIKEWLDHYHPPMAEHTAK